MPSVLLDRIRVRAADDKQAEVSISPNTTANIILSFRTPPGLKGYVTNFGQAFDAGLNTFVKYFLRINGGMHNQFNGLFAQTCAPENAGLFPLSNPIALEQLSLIEVLADVGGAAAPGNFTARVICKYYDLKDVGTI